MESKEHLKLYHEKLKTHPKEKASFLSNFFFCWEISLFAKGRQKGFAEGNLYKPLKEYASKQLGDKLEHLWLEEEIFLKKPCLKRALTKLFGLEFLVYGIIYFPVQIITTLLLPTCIKKLMDYYTPHQQNITQKQAWIYASGLILLSLVRVVFYRWFLMQLSVFGMKVRIACSSLIYRKSLQLQKNDLEKITTGQIVNLLSNDVNKFDRAFMFLHFLWIGPIELMAVTWYMVVTFGYTAIIGITMIILSVFLQICVVKKIPILRRKMALETDQRIRLMNDIIHGIQTIKMYTWENSFIKLVETARSLEIKQIRSAMQCRLINNTFKMYVTKCCIFLVVLVTTLCGTPLTPQYLFALITLYEGIKATVTVSFPSALILFPESLISIQRIQDFLLHNQIMSEPLDKTTNNFARTADKCIMKSYHVSEKKFTGVTITDLSFKWDKSLTKYIFNSENFNVCAGEIVGVVGSAGSGKSTLLQIILREVDCIKGSIEVGGSISYASQDPWIFSASVRQNILFGEELDLEKYNKIVKVCGLEHDVDVLPYGDQTLVGERGIMLSGGQKARINLARAVYRDADIYLLDDPLSAVDVQVARQIFDECILKYLKNKCVVLVTHQIQYLANVNKIYILESGKIIHSEECELTADLKNRIAGDVVQKSTETSRARFLKEKKLPLDLKEHRSSGNTDKKIYKAYCSAAGHCSFTCVVLFLFAVVQLFASFIDYFVAVWIDPDQKTTSLNSKFLNILDTKNRLYIYAGLLAVFVLISHAASLLFVTYCTKASIKLHNTMLFRIVHATMTFFNHHSSGRILNRFSKDMGCTDEALPVMLMNVIAAAFAIININVIVIITNYWMIIPASLLLGVSYFLVTIFHPLNRNLRRTEGTTKSFVFAHVSASIQGLPTIRAFDAQKVLIQEFDNHQDVHSSAFYMFTAVLTTFTFWVDVITVLYNGLTIFSFFLLESGEIYVGNIGLAITQSSALLHTMQFAMTTWIQLNSQMTAVERIVEYSELPLEQIDGMEIPTDKWPTLGNISFESVSLQYPSDDAPVLKNVSFNIKSQEKIGVIGRTGAGKTSLISVLFRLFHFEGSVTVDNVDIKSVPLTVLRSKITIIPQDPVLFLGSLRKNLDPFDKHTDRELWQALEECKLKEVISSQPLGLESTVSERGSNFSVGQRQLLCLVRAMLMNNKIVILDEATANVDLETDELIQSTLKKKFKDCTVLTIAHRLNTVIDSDKILVMDDGLAVEFGHPYQLLQNPNGFFYRYVKNNGGKLMEKLIENSTAI